MTEVFLLGGNSEFYTPEPIQNTIIEYSWKGKQKTEKLALWLGIFFQYSRISSEAVEWLELQLLLYTNFTENSP